MLPGSERPISETPVTTMNPDELIAFLNAIRIGDLDLIRTRLGEAQEACKGLERPDLSDKLGEALLALDGLDMKTYRRRIETVVSNLGHLR